MYSHQAIGLLLLLLLTLLLLFILYFRVIEGRDEEGEGEYNEDGSVGKVNNRFGRGGPITVGKR